VLRALDAGWSGPPFDPVALAEFLKIPTTPTDAVRDARTVPAGANGVRIEYNPIRPRGRVRFSVAHEIAHTFFPDCAEQIRNRSPHTSLEGDAWQLEALCNIAAAEIVMPLAALELSADQHPSVEQLLQERQRFDVSTEALFIRSARVSEKPVAVFTASRTSKGRYRLDYVIGSQTFRIPGVTAGLVLPSTTLVADCRSIGFTAAGDEAWGRSDNPLHIESVGIPPYPGGTFPRVAGILWESGSAEEIPEQSPTLRYVRGDATEPRGTHCLIVHVVNDATPNWGNVGFAAALRKRYPSLQKSFRIWWESTSSPRLGRVHLAEANPDVWVATVVAQHGYGPSSAPRIRYEALAEALEHAAAAAKAHALSVHMPRIGVGQAGGRWDIVEELVRTSFGRFHVAVTVYDLPLETRAGAGQKNGGESTTQPTLGIPEPSLDRPERSLGSSDAGTPEVI
jgi:O-acetyl-ADP-ribose deacetylase (regulator of RNase III)